MEKELQQPKDQDMDKEAQQPKEDQDMAGSGSGDDSSSLSSSDHEDAMSDGEEEESVERVQKLELAIAQNPYNFQDYAEYLQVLRKNSLLEKLREGRDKMSKIFPLSPDMWQEWAQDEARLIASPEDIAAVENLYERGLKDYLSVPLWLDYLEFKKKHDQDVSERTDMGITRMRELYERSLSITSLHFTEGSRIWGAYRQFEMDLLNTLSDSSAEVKEKQVNVIRNLYRRQLSVPLCDSSITLREYSKWESDQGLQIGGDSDKLSGLPANVAMAYKKAIEMCRLREPLEEKISKDKTRDGEVLQSYEAYIALEEGTNDPARVQVLYERAVADFPITAELWLKYIEYLERKLKVHKIILSIYERSVRNCPWLQALWGRYLLAMEQSNTSESDIAKVFDQSLNSGFGFSTPEEYLDHYLTRADGIRRRVPKLVDEAEKQSYLGTLRETFSQAAQVMSTYFPNFIDRSLKLHSYWARLEACLANDIVAARDVWENLIKSSGWMAEVWQGYIAMEVNLGNLAEARAIYRRCYSRKLEGNGSEVLCEAWLRFEREFGSLEDYDLAIPKVATRLAELKRLEQQQEAKTAASAPRDEKSSKKKVVSPMADKKKRNFENEDQDASQKPKVSNKRPKVSSLNGDEKTKNTDQVETPEHGENPSEVHEKPGSTVVTGAKERVWYTDQCTAFVSRLAPEVSEDDIKDFFKECGSIKEVRIMKDRKTGASRGFAYVDFENEGGLLAAVTNYNFRKLKGSKIKVLRSDPSLAGKRDSAGHYDGGDNAIAQGRSGNEDRGSDGHQNQHNRQEGHHFNRQKTDSHRGRGRGGRWNSNLSLHRRGAHVQLSGKNTFAAPRAVVRHTTEGEAPLSNQDFRKMLTKE